MHEDGVTFIIEGTVNPDFNKKIRWCLAKDDVTPHECLSSRTERVEVVMIKLL